MIAFYTTLYVGMHIKEKTEKIKNKESLHKERKRSRREKGKETMIQMHMLKKYTNKQL